MKVPLMLPFRLWTLLLAGSLSISAAQSITTGNVGVVWAAAGGDVSGTVLLRCERARGGCGPASSAHRIVGSGPYAVFKTTPQPDMLDLLWRDLNRNATIDAGDELATVNPSPFSQTRLRRYDGQWRTYLGEKTLDDLYESGTLGTVPPDGPFPALARVPLSAGPAQPTDTNARGTLSGSWKLFASYPASLPPGRSVMDPGPFRQDGKWPLQVLGFQAPAQGRYLHTADLQGVPAGCGPGSQQRLKLEGQFTSGGGTLTLRDTARTVTTTCVKARSPASIPAQVASMCTQAVSALPAEQRKLGFDQCVAALTSGDSDTRTTITKEPLEQHSYRFRRFDTLQSPDARDGQNYLLFLQDTRGNVYVYMR